ncbi:SIMPL domain-containing protein [Sphingobacterium alkalisoli]|uniref:SIMPL domain-containing protein n=1 Tax=Sphingobacterium alkalisoli TaxID=1874115 RepID=A0A4U0H5L8_9SPHI|nr:SIMPL domain-containing protein [Sphingobacterium alkalisoli]TJY67000.1 SIMPL domain-containing protein [Sphingobacterium alkalisoli]GGH12881.1 SIMPL domain-containing protein [Sphingobacterium alkalisoli]
MKYIGVTISVIAAIAFIIFACVLANAYKYKYKVNNTINVTGNAKKDFESDIVKWSATYSRKSMDLSHASEQLRQDRNLVKDFLVRQGIKEEEILFNAVNINRDFTYQTDGSGHSYNTFTGYSLTQTVSVESKDLNKVDNVSREISTLISEGLELSSNSPNYYYSKLEDLKLALIAEASQNAKLRAENIAKESGSRLGGLIKADLGIFQITGQNDNEEYSYGGVFNTTSRLKTANITVKASYGQ